MKPVGKEEALEAPVHGMLRVIVLLFIALDLQQRAQVKC
eukprot:COSAG04_NODE_1562_length_6335_cov_34.922226_1_plen_39_part_00